jgi:hypothetical protein
MAKLVVMKKGGEPGEIAINRDMVTHVRTSSGPFTDVYFGETRVAVEGTFAQVVARLSDDPLPAAAPQPAKNWLVR